MRKFQLGVNDLYKDKDRDLNIKSGGLSINGDASISRDAIRSGSTIGKLPDHGHSGDASRFVFINTSETSNTSDVVLAASTYTTMVSVDFMIENSNNKVLIIVNVSVISSNTPNCIVKVSLIPQIV
ncbi:MAG: hypothetical protein ACTSYZ_09030 [Candidatus Helarchaeota archaeon]